MIKVPYAQAVHGQEEIDAVVNVLKTSTQMGESVNLMEKLIAKIFNKTYGLLTNSGTSALYLAIEVADYYESKRKLNSEDEKLQSTFRSIYASKFKHSDYQKATNDPEHTILHGQIKSSFSTKFLKQNKSWLQ